MAATDTTIYEVQKGRKQNFLGYRWRMRTCKRCGGVFKTTARFAKVCEKCYKDPFEERRKIKPKKISLSSKIISECMKKEEEKILNDIKKKSKK